MRLALALWLSLYSGLAGAADAPFLWQVQGPHATHYLMGSLHLLPDSVYPLPAALEQAYSSTRGLVLETDPAALAAPDTQMRMLADGTAANGLQHEIEPRLYARVRAHAQAGGLPPELCDAFKAWFCALTLGMIEFQNSGMDSGRGLDLYFFQRAVQDQRPIGWLEQPEVQLALFSGMSARMAEQFLASALDDLARPELQPEALVRLWRENQVEVLARMIEQTREEFPETHARLLDDRNAAWIERLIPRIEGAEPQLVIVGAAHLVGPQGLIAQLIRRGYRVRAMSEDAAAP